MNTKIKKYLVLFSLIFIFALPVLSFCFSFSYSNQAFAEDFQDGNPTSAPGNDTSGSTNDSNYSKTGDATDASGSTDASKTNPVASQSKTGSSTSASFDYTPMEKIPGFPTSGDLPEYILAVYKFGIWTIGLSALLMIMIGGFMYITSAGNNASMEKAKGIITDAIIGVLMALSAYLILYVINPELVKIKTINLSMSGASSAQNQATCEQWCRNAGGVESWTAECVAGCGSGTAVRATGTCSDLNDSLKSELNNASGGVPTALLASFMLRECSPAMSNANACNKNNLYGAGGPMQFIDPTWSQYGCSGSKFNRQDALRCAAKKISRDSGGDYSEAGIRKAAKLYCGSCTDPKACGGNYCDGIIANYSAYKSCL